jgi:hypothetical protein
MSERGENLVNERPEHKNGAAELQRRLLMDFSFFTLVRASHSKAYD